MTDLESLEKLLAARPSCVSIVTMDEAHALDLLKDAARRAGRAVRIWSVTQGVHDGMLTPPEAVLDTEHPAAALHHLAHQVAPPMVAAMLDLAGHLGDERTLRVLRDAIASFRDTGSTLVLIDHRGTLPAVVRTEAETFVPSLPSGAEIEAILKARLRAMHREHEIEVDISRTAFVSIIKNLRGLTRGQIDRIIAQVVTGDRRFDDDDLNHVLALKRQMLSAGGLLDYVESPATLDEIGGLSRLKAWLRDRRNALSDEARSFGIAPPRGVLLLGVQGAGKSYCAKAIATAWQRPLLRLDPGSLYDRYVGESERRLREALAQETMAPLVLWIDEIEKGFASAASQSTDGGLSQRMFGALLTWMQDHRSAVFLVATANDVDALPPELLRKGRFDEIFFVDLPDERVRRDIFRTHLEKRGRAAAGFDLEALSRAADGFSGAEIEQAVIAALIDAFSRKEELRTAHLLDALTATRPLSVTMSERVARLRQWAAGRCVRAN
jgi:hypothetical protein